TPLLDKQFKLGQFVSPTTLDDMELTFTLSMDDVNHDTEWAGMSFRMQDPRNRYAVEVDGKSLVLAKYINGARTVLKSSNYPFQSKTDYNFTIKALGNQIEVSLNGVPYLTATDSTYTSGKFGP